MHRLALSSDSAAPDLASFHSSGSPSAASQNDSGISANAKAPGPAPASVIFHWRIGIEDTLFARWMRDRCLPRSIRVYCLSVLIVLCLLAPQVARAQERVAAEANTPSDTEMGVTRNIPARQPVESEISVMSMIPDGNVTMFSATLRCRAWTVAVEYDRHSWGHLLKSKVDYVAEIIPVVILSQPAKSDFWGNARSPNQELVPGLSVLPFGFRLLWRSNAAIKPYLIGKIGVIGFTQKAFSPNASYANFNIQSAFGIQIRMTDRVDLRVEPFEFFHVSNGYLPASNPGMDEMGWKYGIAYHLGRGGLYR